MIRNLGRMILQRYGYRVLLAEDGVDALNVYRSKHDEINLVVLDLTMPRLSAEMFPETARDRSQRPGSAG